MGVLVSMTMTTAVTSAVSEPVRESALASPLDASFLAWAIGLGGLTGVSNRNHDTGPIISLQLGQRIAHHLQLTEKYVAIFGTPYATDPVLVDDYNQLSIGIRWIPFCPKRAESVGLWRAFRFFDVSAVYVDATLGVGQLTRSSHGSLEKTETSMAPLGEITVGWLPMQGLEYAIGFAVRAEASRYSEGTGYGLDAVVVAQWSH